MSVFIVAGATGHVGSVVARELLAAGHEVRAIVRDLDKSRALASSGAELLSGELSDAEFLTGALGGADAAFLLLPPPPHDSPDVRAFQDRVARAESTAVAESGIRHVVLLSSWGAEKPSGTGPLIGLHVMEEALKETKARWTFLRACPFTENLLTMVPTARDRGILPNFFPPAHRLSMVATRDVGSAAVRALLSPTAASEAVYQLGIREYSPVDQAVYLSKKLGRDVELVTLPVSAVAGTMRQGGVGASLACLIQEMYEGATKGLFGVEPGHRVERGPTTLEQALDPHFGTQP